MSWKREALHAKETVRDAKHKPYEMARQAVVRDLFGFSHIYYSQEQASGSARPSFTTSLIADAIKHGRLSEEEEDILNAAGGLYGGEKGNIPPLRVH